MTIIKTVEQLRKIYRDMTEASILKVTKTLTPEYRTLIETAPFVALATVGEDGLDCSPRGDLGGVVRVQDDKTLLLPDWRGNNRVDSLMNVVRDPRVALMFLIPGSNTAMRINGEAVVSIAPELLGSFEVDGKHPRTVMVISIKEAYFQCARALMRSRLWDPSLHVDAKDLPTPGQLLKAAKADFDQETYDREWVARAEATMW